MDDCKKKHNSRTVYLPVKKGSVVVYVVQQLQQHATSSLLMINGYIHVMSCNRMCTDYYKLGPEILGWCKTCISNREGMYTENMAWYVWVHVQDADMCIKLILTIYLRYG